MSITILLADDHPVVRQGLRNLLEAEPDFQVVGETGDGSAVLPLVERLNPDVLVLDLKMPDISGIEITRQVRQQYPAVKIVILSMYSNIAYVAESLDAGAQAFIPKKSTAEELVHAIREVVAGRQYLSSTLSDETGSIEHRLEIYRLQAGDSLALYDTLTRRERDVLHLVGKGSTSAEIAERLFISPRTVDMHRRHMVRKLGLSGKAALMRYALQRDFILDE